MVHDDDDKKRPATTSGVLTRAMQRARTSNEQHPSSAPRAATNNRSRATQEPKVYDKSYYFLLSLRGLTENFTNPLFRVTIHEGHKEVRRHTNTRSSSCFTRFAHSLACLLLSPLLLYTRQAIQDVLPYLQACLRDGDYTNNSVVQPRRPHLRPNDGLKRLNDALWGEVSSPK